MNKLIKNIKTYWTHGSVEHMANTPMLPELINPFVKNNNDLGELYYSGKRLRGYYIGVKWGTEVTCTEDDLPRMKEIVAKRLNNGIFGELIDDMYRLKQALLEYDNDKAREIVDEILDEIR